MPVKRVVKQNARPAKGRGNRGTTFIGRAGTLLDPLNTNNFTEIGCPGNVGSDGSDYQQLPSPERLGRELRSVSAESGSQSCPNRPVNFRQSTFLCHRYCDISLYILWLKVEQVSRKKPFENYLYHQWLRDKKIVLVFLCALGVLCGDLFLINYDFQPGAGSSQSFPDSPRAAPKSPKWSGVGSARDNCVNEKTPEICKYPGERKNLQPRRTQRNTM